MVEVANSLEQAWKNILIIGQIERPYPLIGHAAAGKSFALRFSLCP
jgi:hypothetical protein